MVSGCLNAPFESVSEQREDVSVRAHQAHGVQETMAACACVARLR